MSIPHWSGKNARIVFFQDNSKITLDNMSWTVKAEGEKVQDGVCGEDRDRLDFIITHYSISIESQQQDVSAVNKLLDDTANADANAVPLEKAIGFIIYPNNGTKAGFQAREVCRDDWSMNNPGRTARNKLSIPCRARYFDPLSI